MKHARERVRQRLKGPVRRVSRRIGYEIVAVGRDESADLVRIMADHRIDLLLDVGANQGQYAEKMRAAGFTGDIVSFEPGQLAFRTLDRIASRDMRWEARRLALGRERSTLTLNVSANSVSSSLLKMRDRHLNAAENSAVVGREEVEVVRLDQVIPVSGRPTMLKIDTQGFELSVLGGVGALLEQIQLVQVEVSFVELYSGQASYIEVLNELDGMGFVPCMTLPGFTDPATSETLQIDIVAKRSGPTGSKWRP